MVGVEPVEGAAAGVESSASMIRPSLSRSARSKRRCSLVRASAEGGVAGVPETAGPAAAGGASGIGSSSSCAIPDQMKKPAVNSSMADPAPAKNRSIALPSFA